MIIQDEKVLRERSVEIDPTDRQLMSFLESKLVKEAKRHGEAVGLAAPQIGTKKRAFIMWGGDGNFQERWILYVNPRIIEKSDEMQELVEGCLSFPGVQVKTRRHQQITVQDDFNDYKTYVLEGFEAAVFQHELDHLDGIMFMDRGEIVKPMEATQ